MLTAQSCRFEVFVVRQKACLRTQAVYRVLELSSTRSGAFAQDYGLRDQIWCASFSVISNIAEGFEGGSDKEFSQFLVVVKASCAEVRSQLHVAFDVGYLSEEQFQTLMDSANEVGRPVGGLHAAALKRIAAQSRN